MTFDEYQKAALRTDITKDKGTGVMSIAFMDKVLGLTGESGEFADKIKKILRDKDAQINEEDNQELVKELGDVLWYIAVLADYLGVSLDELATRNINKLAKRHTEGKLTGKGDNR
jgi:NTP pyrophosphatase (non-canonical NTP hydrolase)